MSYTPVTIAAWKARGVEGVHFFLHQPGDVTAPELLNQEVELRLRAKPAELEALG